jgi:uncharacterized phage-associated protein
MCYSASTIARYFVEKASIADGKTPMQLNKMTYIAHGWCLAIYNRPLILEDVEAWKYGPVIRNLYYDMKKYGNGIVPYIPVQETRCVKEDDKELLDKVFDVYDKFDALQLSSMTHQKGTPWDTVWNNHGQNYPIPNDLIKDYYINKGRQNIPHNGA